ncbi:MAG: hypothetical protein GQ557_00535 [Mycoplasmataceae bacterium]|nr:hypothetical protein [Mycoplasmataceae bacterium]
MNNNSNDNKYSKKNHNKLVISESKFATFSKNFYRRHFKGISPMRQILLWYFFITIVGTAFLMTPWVLKEGIENPGFIDSLFMSSSAFSDTGLTTLNIYDTYNWFGEFVLLVLIEIGGIGWFAIKIFALLFFVKKIKFSESSQAGYEKGSGDFNITMGVIKIAVIVTIGVTIIFGFIFGIIFATIEPVNLASNYIVLDLGDGNSLYYFGPEDLLLTTDPSELQEYFAVLPTDMVGLQGNWWGSFKTGIFHAGASINNSGLDVFAGNYSLAGYYSNYGIETITVSLFILGGIGFGVIYDCVVYVKHRATGQTFKFSLVTKVSVVSYALVAISGLGLVFLFEGLSTISNETNSAFLINDENGTMFARIYAIGFNTFSTRNAGFSTTDISAFSTSSQFIFILMMFIGSGPGSTAGGIRTTTFFVLILSTWTQMRGKENINIYKRTIPKKESKSARNTFFFSLIIILFTALIILSAEEISLKTSSIGDSVYSGEINGLLDVLFVTTSAFGTTGLSPVSLDDATVVSKMMLILMMFLGKMGMGATISQFASKNPKDPSYMEETLNIG